MKKEVKLKSVTGDDGQLISPSLPNGIKNYLIDIDGTITDDVPNEEPERMRVVHPYPEALSTLNQWYEEGHIITFFTARSEEHRGITENWLNKHGFKYHGLLMGKPRGGNYHWIDDRVVKATQYRGSWGNLVREYREIEVFGE